MLARYRDWLADRIAEDDRVVVAALLALPTDAVLGCWCAPKPCHCQTIIEFATRLREGVL